MSQFLRTISVKLNPGAWAYYAKRNADERFASYKKTVAYECNDTCQFCGFKDKSYMEVINLDGNYKNNKVTNMVLACPLCAQCFFLEMIGKVANTGAVLIYLPEMSQEDLNGLCHALFCAILNGTKYASVAQATYNDLRLLSKVVEETYGAGMSNPAFMGQMIIDTPLENKDNVSKRLLSGVRVLPLLNKFTKCVETWSQTALGSMS